MPDHVRFAEKSSAIPLMVIVRVVGTPPKPLSVWSPVLVPLEVPL